MAMSESNQHNQQTPTAMGTAIEFSMAWLATQGDIGKMVQRTLVTALQEAQGLREALAGQTQDLIETRQRLLSYEQPPKEALPEGTENFKTYSPETPQGKS